MSSAVPGLQRDMLAFTKDTMLSISTSLDFLNVMAYDLMNRRDNVTKHHTGLTISLSAVDAYIERGLPAEKVNLGFAFYIRWYRTAACRRDQQPLGCSTVLLEDPKTGADLGQAGAFSWHDKVPSELLISFEKAMDMGRYDFDDGGHSFWDSDENIFWSWDTPFAIERKVQLIAANKNLGGVFAWGLGEDAEEWSHLDALNKAFTGWRAPGANNRVHARDEL
jgi:GH18 family chitinase